jgi:hypothetical protein
MITANQIINEINEVSDDWTIRLQMKYGKFIKSSAYYFDPSIYKDTFDRCINFLKNKSGLGEMQGSGGVIVNNNTSKNIFFKIDKGNLTTSQSPLEGLKAFPA